MSSTTSRPSPAIEVEVARTLHLGGAARARKLARRTALALAALAVIALGVRAWQRRGERPPPSFATVPVERGELTVSVTATGTLEARNLVVIGSEVSGRIARVAVDVNERVTRGQVLAEIDPELLTAQAAQAAAQLAQARAQVAQARATRREASQARARTERLFAAGVATPQEREGVIAADERAAAAVALADAAVAQATASLRLVKSNLARTVVRSPIDGVVLVRDAEVGQTVVAAFQAPVLFQIAEDLRAMTASVDVDEADVGEVHEGAAATFTVAAYLGRTFDAKVASVHNAARLVDRVVTYETELDVENPALVLRPGMTVTAEIVARRLPDALLVPAQALRFTPAGETRDGGGERVWILRDGRPVAIEVEVTGRDDTTAAVVSPALGPGVAVIVGGTP